MVAAFDAATSLGSGSGNLSGTHTPVGVPSTAIVVVCNGLAAGNNSGQTNAATYGGVAMQSKGKVNAAGTDTTGDVEVFALDSPPSGPQTVAVTVTGGTGTLTNIAAVMTATGGYCQTSPTRTNTGSSQTTASTGAFPTTSGGLLVAGMCAGSTLGTESGGTRREQVNVNTLSAGGNLELMTAASTGGSITMTVAITTADDYASIAFEVLAPGDSFAHWRQRPPGMVSPAGEGWPFTPFRWSDAGAPASSNNWDPGTQTDDAGLTDSTVIDQSPVYTDDTGLTDPSTVSHGIVVALTDDTGLTDSATVVLIRTAAQTDVEGLTDPVVIDRGLGVIDPANPTDSISLAQGHTLTDDPGLTDSAAVVLFKLVAQTDTAGLTDSVTASLGHIVTQTDDTGLTDSFAVLAPVKATDDTGLTDPVALAQGHAVTDTSGLTDAATQVVFKLVQADDPAGLTDSIATAHGIVSALTDDTGLTDSTTVVHAASTASTDSAGLTDSVVVLKTTDVAATDLAGITDATAVSQAHAYTDSAGLVDILTIAHTSVVVAADVATLTDSVNTDLTSPTLVAVEHPGATLTRNRTRAALRLNATGGTLAPNGAAATVTSGGAGASLSSNTATAEEP